MAASHPRAALLDCYYVNGGLAREPAGTSEETAREKLKEIHKALNQGTYLAPSQKS